MTTKTYLLRYGDDGSSHERAESPEQAVASLGRELGGRRAMLVTVCVADGDVYDAPTRIGAYVLHADGTVEAGAPATISSQGEGIVEGAQVHGGEPYTDTYDEGEVVAVHGGEATVAWRDGGVLPCPVSCLALGHPGLWG